MSLLPAISSCSLLNWSDLSNYIILNSLQSNWEMNQIKVQIKWIVNVYIMHVTWVMLSWHCETELIPGSSIRSFILLPESLLREYTFSWCFGCSGSTNSVLEITSIRPDLTLSLSSCPWFNWMLRSSSASAFRREQICWSNDWAVERWA